jgi:hypothetical protein
MAQQKRILHYKWDLYDTRHVVFRPAKLTAAALEEGYWQAYHDFYRWGSIFQGAWSKQKWSERARHLAYAGGWKKFEPLWDWIIRAKRVNAVRPLLESVLACFGRYLESKDDISRLHHAQKEESTNLHADSLFQLEPGACAETMAIEMTATKIE